MIGLAKSNVKYSHPACVVTASAATKLTSFGQPPLSESPISRVTRVPFRAELTHMPNSVSVLELRPRGAIVPRLPFFPVASVTPAALAESPVALVNSITVLPERFLEATLAPLNAVKVTMSAASKPRVLNFKMGTVGVESLSAEAIAMTRLLPENSMSGAALIICRCAAKLASDRGTNGPRRLPLTEFTSAMEAPTTLPSKSVRPALTKRLPSGVCWKILTYWPSLLTSWVRQSTSPVDESFVTKPCSVPPALD